MTSGLVRLSMTYRIQSSAIQRDFGGGPLSEQRNSALRLPHQDDVGPGLHFPRLMKSATRSPIIRTVTFILARTHSGMIEASTTRRPSAP